MSDKFRNWTFLVWESSAPVDWIRDLQEFGVPFCVSPKHDRDVWDDPKKLPKGKQLGDPKAPHWHIALKFSGPVNYGVVADLCESLNTQHPERIREMRPMIQYFWHRNNPEKAQYDPDDLQEYLGFDLKEALKPVGSELRLIKKELKSFVRDNEIQDFADLVEKVDDIGNRDWEYVLEERYTLFFRSWLQSRFFREKDARENGNVRN